MNNLIYKYDNGITIFSIIGRGIVISFPPKSGYFYYKNHVGDKWIFDFMDDEAPKIAEVKSVEISNRYYDDCPFALCFGAQFTKDEIQKLKIGQCQFRKIIDKFI